jgi:hypothetical protein
MTRRDDPGRGWQLGTRAAAIWRGAMGLAIVLLLPLRAPTQLTYEVPPVRLQASAVLIQGPDHQVADDVVDDGYLNLSFPKRRPTRSGMGSALRAEAVSRLERGDGYPQTADLPRGQGIGDG